MACKTDHSLLSGALVKNEWGNTSTSSCLHDVYWENFVPYAVSDGVGVCVCMEEMGSHSFLGCRDISLQNGENTIENVYISYVFCFGVL